MSEIDISNVSIRILDYSKNGLIGYASCVVNDGIKLNNIRIQRSREGKIYLVYPARIVRKDGGEEKRYPYFNPIHADVNDMLSEAILGKLQVIDGLESASDSEFAGGIREA